MANRRKCHTCSAELAFLALLITLFTFPTAALAQAPAAAGKNSEDSTTTARIAGQTVAIDRQTGKLRQPTPEEARALAAGLQKMLNHSTEGLTAIRHPNGALTVNLQNRFQSVSLAAINSDGSVTERCVTNNNEATAFVKSMGTKPSASRKSKTASSKTTTTEKEN